MPNVNVYLKKIAELEDQVKFYKETISNLLKVAAPPLSKHAIAHEVLKGGHFKVDFKNQITLCGDSLHIGSPRSANEYDRRYGIEEWSNRFTLCGANKRYAIKHFISNAEGFAYELKQPAHDIWRVVKHLALENYLQLAQEMIKLIRQVDLAGG